MQESNLADFPVGERGVAGLIFAAVSRPTNHVGSEDVQSLRQTVRLGRWPLQAHARAQEALAEALRSAGKAPRSPAPGEPVFDLAWEDDGTICVAEVKSLSGSNEEKQLGSRLDKCCGTRIF